MSTPPMDEPKTTVPAPGGFLLPSPAPSSAATATTSRLGLPHPRARPLRPGSAKEDVVRNYAAGRMMHVNRRYVKKFADNDNHDHDDGVGYSSVGELCADLEDLVSLLWRSGTPSLQIPFLLDMACSLNSWLPNFPAARRPTVRLLSMLDHCFASLLSGHDVDSAEPLPGFANGLARAGLSTTDMVRCRSIIEESRRVAVKVLGGDMVDYEEDTDTDTETDADVDAASATRKAAWHGSDDGLYMDVARIYEKTLVKLGERLGSGLEVGEVHVSNRNE